MNNQFLAHLSILSLLFMFSCGGDSQTPEAETTIETETTEVEESNTAICLWPKVGLREQPGVSANIKYLTTIYFGESVTLSGESEELEKDKKTYIKVSLSDGSEGWVQENLFATQGKLATASKPIEIYKRPDIMTFSDKKVEMGEIVALLPGDKEDWKEIVGKEKKKKGWIRANDNLTTNDVDVKVAIMYQQAMDEKEKNKQNEKLQAISENPAFASSPFLDMVQDQLAGAAEMEEKLKNLAPTQLYILATKLNVRSEPTIEEENVVFQVSEGYVCEILEKGDKELVNDNEDFWYRIEYDGQEGWVFGHHTSKKITSE